MAAVSHPLPGDEAARLEALREYAILDTPPEAAFDQLTRLAAYICRTPMALVVFLDEKRQWFKSRVGFDLAETPREWSFCGDPVREKDLLVVSDATQDPRFSWIPYVREAPDIRFYAGTALRSPEGLALGTLCVLDRVPRALDPEQLDALRTLGRQAEAQLELRRQGAQLRQAREQSEARAEQGQRESAALRESEERFRQLAESLQDVVWIRTLEPRVLYVSPAFERVWGLPREALYQDAGAATELIHPEDRAAALDTATTLPEGEYDSQFRIVRPDGEQRWIRSRGFPIRDADGVVRRIAGISQDITERMRAEEALRESEERFRQVAENVQDVFWIREADPPRVLYINPAYERIWGRPRAELDADPRAFLQGIHPEDRERVAQLFVRQGFEPYEEEYRVVRPDGSVRWVLARAFGVRDERGEVRRVAGVVQDISARKAAEAELQAQKELLANLLAVARATTELPGLEATLTRTLEIMKGLTGAETASLFLLDEAGRLTRSLFSLGEPQGDDRREESRRALDGGLASWVVRHQEPALVEDVERDPRWTRIPSRPFPARAALCVPILSGHTPVGVLNLEHSRPGYFGPRQLELVRAASDQMALALLNAQIFDALDGMAERQATLYGVLRTAGEQLDPDESLGQAVSAIAQRTGWPNVAISVPGADGFWEVRASRAALSNVGRQPVKSGVVGRAYLSGRVQRVRDVREDPDYVEGSPAIRSELAVPIRRGEHVLGVLNAESDVVDGFGDEDVGLAESLADAVGLALENARLYHAVAAESDRVTSLVRASQDGILLVGGDGRVLLGNDPACRLLGLAGVAEDWVGRPLADLLRPLRGASPAGEAMMATAAAGTWASDGPSDGECVRPPYALRWSVRAVRAGGVLLGRSLVLRDVTEERRAQRLQEDLTHTMVHDLRNPLTSLQGAVEMLSVCEPPFTDRQRGLFEIAERSTQRVLGLVNAILDVTRLEKGALPVNPRSLEMAAVVEEALTFHEHMGRQRGIALVNAVPPGLPKIAADPSLLDRVLQNLVGNALRYTPGGGRVSVGARVSPADDCFLEVVVEDTGPGFPEEVRERLFQKFVTGGQGGGSGLGLAFCRLAIEAHAGRIWLEPLTTGSAVRFTLPVHA